MLVIIVVVIALSPLLFFRGLSMSARRPSNLGTTEGLFSPCPSSPNCVSSQADPADRQHYIAPFGMANSAIESIVKLSGVITEMPRTRIVERTPNYLSAEFTSAIFRYVDDVEFYVDEEAV